MNLSKTFPNAPTQSGTKPASREERLAQQLRENLRRRKAQARALDARAEQEGEAADDAGGAGPESGAESA